MAEVVLVSCLLPFVFVFHYIICKLKNLTVCVSLSITVNYFSTKYLNHSAGCVSLPEQMKVRVCPMDELPCYVDGSTNLIESDSEWEDYGEAGSASGSQEESFTNVAVHTSPANELLKSSKAYDRQQLGEALSFGAQGGQESSSVNSPIRALSPVMPSLSSLEDTPNGRNVFTFIEEFGDELDNNQQSFRIKDRGSTSCHPVTSQEIDIIELATPSPDPRGKELHGKRRRVSTACPEIIDLTNSPVSVQL